MYWQPILQMVLPDANKELQHHRAPSPSRPISHSRPFSDLITANLKMLLIEMRIERHYSNTPKQSDWHPTINKYPFKAHLGQNWGKKPTEQREAKLPLARMNKTTSVEKLNQNDYSKVILEQQGPY